MKLSANNIANENFDISIELAESEQELDKAVCEFGFALGRMVCEFSHLFAKNKQQASALNELIQMIVKNTTDEYIKASFDTIAKLREEAQMYKYMKDIYTDWLDRNKKTERDVLDKFHNADTMKFEVYEKYNIITIALTNSNGTIFEFLETFNTSDLTEAEIEQKVSIAYIVGVIISDKIYDNEEENSIRQLEHTPGFVDGGIMQQIQNTFTKKGE